MAAVLAVKEIHKKKYTAKHMKKIKIYPRDRKSCMN